MLDSRRYSYFEYISIAFFFISILYFTNAFYSKYHSNNKIIIDSTLKNFDIYNHILDKYNAKVIDFKVVDGVVEAFIEQGGFVFDEFDANEPYLVEKLEDNYLITFKFIKKIEKKAEEKKIVSAPVNRMEIDSFCFISNDEWFFSINGFDFDKNNLKKDEIEVVSVKEDKIILNIANVEKAFYF